LEIWRPGERTSQAGAGGGMAAVSQQRDSHIAQLMPGAPLQLPSLAASNSSAAGDVVIQTSCLLALL